MQAPLALLWPQLQYYMQWGVLHFKDDVDHLKQAIKMVKGMEKKTWCFYSICISTKTKKIPPAFPFTLLIFF